MVKLQTRTLISSLIALLGIWLIVRQIPGFASSLVVVLTDKEQVPASILKIHAIHLFTHLLLGVGLIVLRNAITRWLVPGESGARIFFRVFLAAGTALLGIYFISYGVISLGESLGSRDPNFGANPYLYWRGVFSVSIGALLFFGSVGISRLWTLLLRLRHVGI